MKEARLLYFLRFFNQNIIAQPWNSFIILSASLVSKNPYTLSTPHSTLIPERPVWATRVFKRSNLTPSSKMTNGISIIFEIAFRQSFASLTVTTILEISTMSKMRHLARTFRNPRLLPEITCPLSASHIRKIISWWPETRRDLPHPFLDG